MRGKGLILLTILMLSAIIFIGLRSYETSQVAKATVGLDAPDAVLADIAGNTYHISGLKGSVVFINFWASWCKPCRDEMPSLQSLYNQFKDDKRLRMLMVLYRDDYEKALSYMKENNFDFPVIIDKDGKAASAYGITGVPETYIIDRKGILKEKIIGPNDWTSAQSFSLLSNLIRE